MNLFEIEPTEIIVKEELPRFRTDMGDVKGLLDSIKEYGQLQPIVLNREGELIDGGRRLAACALGGLKVMAIYKDVVDNMTMRELELEVNLKRKALTAAEEALAVGELHQMKQDKIGKSTSGREGGWKIQDTAGELNKSHTYVVENLAIAEGVKDHPELKDCKTKSEIVKALKGITKVQTRTERLEEYQQELKRQDNIPTLLLQDSMEYMQSIPDKEFDLVVTDPLYGIDADEIRRSLNGVTGKFTSAGFKSKDIDLPTLALQSARLAGESYRFTKDNGHVYVFVAPRFFHLLTLAFEDAGWKVHVKPIIWYKRASGQTNQPTMWPASCFDMIMFARKPDSRLVLEGRPDVIENFPPVTGSARIHEYEKPVLLMRELIMRTCLPGAKIFDPFMGSAPTAVAALELKMFFTGCDIDEDAYSAAVQRVARHKRKEKLQ